MGEKFRGHREVIWGRFFNGPIGHSNLNFVPSTDSTLGPMTARMSVFDRRNH